MAWLHTYLQCHPGIQTVSFNMQLLYLTGLLQFPYSCVPGYDLLCFHFRFWNPVCACSSKLFWKSQVRATLIAENFLFIPLICCIYFIFLKSIYNEQNMWVHFTIDFGLSFWFQMNFSLYSSSVNTHFCCWNKYTFCLSALEDDSQCNINLKLLCCWSCILSRILY